MHLRFCTRTPVLQIQVRSFFENVEKTCFQPWCPTRLMLRWSINGEPPSWILSFDHPFNGSCGRIVSVPLTDTNKSLLWIHSLTFDYFPRLTDLNIDRRRKATLSVRNKGQFILLYYLVGPIGCIVQYCNIAQLKFTLNYNFRCPSGYCYSLSSYEPRGPDVYIPWRGLH